VRECHLGTAVTRTKRLDEERGMTTTPNHPSADDGNGDSDVPGAEIGISEGEGSSFEPEEDPEPEA
jgi:hypothetical protein